MTSSPFKTYANETECSGDPMRSCGRQGGANMMGTRSGAWSAAVGALAHLVIALGVSMSLLSLLMAGPAVAWQMYDCGGYSWPNPNCPAPPAPSTPPTSGGTITVRAQSSLGAVIICEPANDVWVLSGSVRWRAYITCEGTPQPGAMAGLYVASTGTQAGTTPMDGNTDTCGDGSVTNYAGDEVIWPASMACMPDDGVMSWRDCTTCAGEWLVTGRFALVFPVTFGITAVTGGSCRLGLPNEAYCEITGYGNAS